MNFIPIGDAVPHGARSVVVKGAKIPIPETLESIAHPRGFLGARAEHIKLSDRGELRGTVFGIEYMGARQLVTVDTSAGRLKVRAPNTARVADGENVGLEFMPDRLSLFDGDTDLALKTRARQ